jgi:hypothetical protein
MDLTIAKDSVANESRVDDRFKRTLPVLITPWRGDETSNSESHIGITRDMSDNGIKIFFLKLPQESEFLLSFVLKREKDKLERFHFLADVRDSKRFAPDIYSVGLYIKEHLEEIQVSASVVSLIDLIGEQYEFA